MKYDVKMSDIIKSGVESKGDRRKEDVGFCIAAFTYQKYQINNQQIPEDAKAVSNGCEIISLEDLEMKVKCYTFEGKGSKWSHSHRHLDFGCMFVFSYP